MTKYRKYSSLSRSQKYRRLQKMRMPTETAPASTSRAGACVEIPRQTSTQCEASLAENMDQHCSSLPILDISPNTTMPIQCDMARSPRMDSDQLIESTLRDNSDSSLTDQIIEDNDPRNVPSFPELLASWARDFNITQVVLTKLLRIHQLHGFEGLPVSARALLRTPRSTIIQKTASGSYFHYGLEKALQDHLKTTERPVEADSEIQINLNIDGLPIAKSSKSQLWPILGQVFDSELQRPFLIGVCHGFSKPSSPFEILSEFVSEFSKLRQEGFE